MSKWCALMSAASVMSQLKNILGNKTTPPFISRFEIKKPVRSAEVMITLPFLGKTTFFESYSWVEEIHDSFWSVHGRIVVVVRFFHKLELLQV